MHLLKERAKLHREKSARKVYTIGKRLNSQIINQEEEKQNGRRQEKRPNVGSNIATSKKAKGNDDKMELK